MLRGKHVVLRAREKEDLKRLHELQANVELVLLGDGVWRPEPLAAWEKEFDKHLEERDKADFVIEVDGVVIGEIGLHQHMNRRRASRRWASASTILSTWARAMVATRF